MSWIVFTISGVLLAAYAVIFYFYLQKTKLRKVNPSPWKENEPSAQQKEIEEELIELEHIELDLPEGVCVLPPGAFDPSLTANIKRDSH